MLTADGGAPIAYTLDIVPDGQVLRVRVSGAVDDESVSTHAADVERIISAGKTNDCRGILLDVREATIELRSATRITDFMAFAEMIPHGMRLASLGVAEPEYKDGFNGLLAGSRGLLYRAFENEAAALAWLQKD